MQNEIDDLRSQNAQLRLQLESTIKLHHEKVPPPTIVLLIYTCDGVFIFQAQYLNIQKQELLAHQSLTVSKQTEKLMAV